MRDFQSIFHDNGIFHFKTDDMFTLYYSFIDHLAVETQLSINEVTSSVGISLKTNGKKVVTFYSEFLNEIVTTTDKDNIFNGFIFKFSKETITSTIYLEIMPEIKIKFNCFS